ncbi:MAG: prephenate dehydrogenase/arogenate dehydrogenase family protein [Chthonomonadales bacterium]|nr:prephenate dehydrogenase/arogenate dehydrogenase family protein [Chthonomonadales bacterium]
MGDTADGQSIAIIGLGLIGSSIGLALKRAAPRTRIVGLDRSPTSADTALRIGAVDRVTEHGSEAVQRSDVIIIATPIDTVVDVAGAIIPYVRDDAAVTDVGGTKERIVRECEPLLGGRFVGGHPMAGSERSGPSAARPDMFRHAPWLLTPTPATQSWALDRITGLVATLGARPSYISPAQHDRLQARLSALPHLLAFVLAAVGQQLDTNAAAHSGGSFRDATRVARSSPDVWAAILADNGANVVDALIDTEARLRSIREALNARNIDHVAELLREGHTPS